MSNEFMTLGELVALLKELDKDDKSLFLDITEKFEEDDTEYPFAEPIKFEAINSADELEKLFNSNNYSKKYSADTKEFANNLKHEMQYVVYESDDNVIVEMKFQIKFGEKAYTKPIYLVFKNNYEFQEWLAESITVAMINTDRMTYHLQATPVNTDILVRSFSGKLYQAYHLNLSSKDSLLNSFEVFLGSQSIPYEYVKFAD